ncbi:hypothetical protein [Spirosoma gilvum]
MNAGTFFVRAWRILSIIGFVGSLFASYISYPEEVAVRFDDLKQPIQTINREVIFYLSIAIFLITNTVGRLISKLFLRVPTAQIPVPHPGSWASHRSKLNEIFTNWFYALMAAVNTIVALGLFVLSLLNRGDRSLQPFDYAWLLPVSTVILIAVLVGLPVRLFMKPGHDD